MVDTSTPQGSPSEISDEGSSSEPARPASALLLALICTMLNFAVLHFVVTGWHIQMWGHVSPSRWTEDASFIASGAAAFFQLMLLYRSELPDAVILYAFPIAVWIAWLFVMTAVFLRSGMTRTRWGIAGAVLVEPMLAAFWFVLGIGLLSSAP